MTKRLWFTTLCGIMALTLAQNARASELTEEKDIEVELTNAEADGAVTESAHMNEKVERARIAAHMNIAAANRAVKKANDAQVKAETNIGKAEQELRVLREQQLEAKSLQKRAMLLRTDAQRRLATMIQQMRAYRAIIKKTQQRTLLEQKMLKSTRAKIESVQQKVPKKTKRG